MHALVPFDSLVPWNNSLLPLQDNGRTSFGEGIEVLALVLEDQ